jgi:hypothetical protein
MQIPGQDSVQINRRAMSTRPITGIDQNVKLNRALWMLADAMRQMKA